MLHVQAMDHIVLNVADVERTIAFYVDVLGMPAERLDEWRAGRAPFPSLRISADTLIDVVAAPAGTERAGRVENLNHFCMVIDADTLEPVVEHLARIGVPVHTGPVKRWGAHGDAASIYLRDPDGNEIELRTYAPAALALLGIPAPAVAGA